MVGNLVQAFCQLGTLFATLGQKASSKNPTPQLGSSISSSRSSASSTSSSISNSSNGNLRAIGDSGAFVIHKIHTILVLLLHLLTTASVYSWFAVAIFVGSNFNWYSNKTRACCGHACNTLLSYRSRGAKKPPWFSFAATTLEGSLGSAPAVARPAPPWLGHRGSGAEKQPWLGHCGYRGRGATLAWRPQLRPQDSVVA